MTLLPHFHSTDQWPETISTRAMEAILDCLHEAVCIVDAGGLVRFWNKGAEREHGVAREVLVGRPLTESFPGIRTDGIRLSGEKATTLRHVSGGTAEGLSPVPMVIRGTFVGVMDSVDGDTLGTREQLEKIQSQFGLVHMEVKSLTGRFGDLVGSNPAFLEQTRLARRIASSSASVLLTGECGTGKTVFARKIHELSGRQGDFVIVDCGAIPPDLFEDMCFGREDGGAAPRPGFFEQADNGTLFLDDVAAMPTAMQARFLRVLQEREFVRQGGGEARPFTARVVAACNEMLVDAVRNGEFREDLWYRLVVVEIRLPPLRRRKEDIPALVSRYAAEFAQRKHGEVVRPDAETLAVLCRYDWPGNIRELISAVEHMVAVTTGRTIRKTAIPASILERLNAGAVVPPGESLNLLEAVSRVEKAYILEALRRTQHNRKQAAQLLNLSRATLYNKLRVYGLDSAGSDCNDGPDGDLEDSTDDVGTCAMSPGGRP